MIRQKISRIFFYLKLKKKNINYMSIKVNADLYQDIVLENISIIVAMKVTTMKLATQPQICKIRT